MKYIELKENLKELYSLIEQNGIEGYEDTLLLLQEELEDKAKFYANIILSAKDKINFYKTIVDKYKNLIEKEEKNIQFFSDRLIDLHTSYGIDKIKDNQGLPILSVSTRRTEQVIVKDVSLLPDEYIRKKEIIEPDKNAIKQAIKDNLLQANDNVYLLENVHLNLK